MPVYEIAGITVNITTDTTALLKGFQPFTPSQPGTTELELTIEGCDHIPAPGGTMLLDGEVKWLWKDDGTTACMFDDDNGDTAAVLEVCKDWQRATLSYRKRKARVLYSIIRPLDELFFRNALLPREGLVLHSSAVLWEGKSLLFSAPSGTGKSTQADLWKKYMGAQVMNGDRPAIRFVDNKPIVFGTPWSGSSPDRMNSAAPLWAVVLLEQAPVNGIRRLTVSEAVKKIFPRCFLPYFDIKLMDHGMKTLERILHSTPVYLLQCRPDREAVETVYECISKTG